MIYLKSPRNKDIFGRLMGEYEEYTWGFPEFHVHLVPLIPYLAIVKTILVRSLIFHIGVLIDISFS